MSLDFLSHYFWNIWAGPYFLSFGFSLILTLLLVLKKRNDKQVQLYISSQFFITVLSLAAALATSSSDPAVWLIWSAINIVTSLFATTTIFHFSVQVFQGEDSIFESKKILVIYAIPLVYSLIWLINPNLIYPDVVEVESSAFGIYGAGGTLVSGLLVLFFYVYLALMVTLAIRNFVRMFRQTVDLELRRRAAYFVLSSLVPGIALTLTLCLQLLVVGYRPKLEMSIVSLSVSGAIIAYGILKDQLFDLDVIVSKSVKYTLLNIILAWVFVISREILIPIISSAFFSGNDLALIMAGFVVVTVFIPLKNVTSNFTAKLFPRMGDTPSPITKNLEIYQTQLALTWAEGQITEKERMLLTTLRSSLEISEVDHKRIEREVLGDHD